MFGDNKEKKNFYKNVIKSKTQKESVEKYLPILANELYDRFVSESSKKALGVNQLYVNGVETHVELNENATAVDTAIAYNELTDLIYKTMSFTRLFKDEAHSNYHQFVDDLTDKNSKPSEAQKRPIILSFEDLIKEIEAQPIEEHTIYTDEKIANGDVTKISSKILDIKMSLLKVRVQTCLVSVVFGIRINSDETTISR